MPATSPNEPIGGILAIMSALTDANPEVRRIRFFQLWVPIGCAIIGLPVLYLRGWDTSGASPWQAVALLILLTICVIVPASLVTAVVLTVRRSRRMGKPEQDGLR
jgi:uncharacterized membrane protein YhaH (DUF805 family)